MPSSIRCCDFSPNPFIGATSPLSQASLRAFTESTPNSSCINLIRLGPNPGIASISINPAGVLSCNSCQSSAHSPCSTASVIAPPIPLPIPFNSNNKPVATNLPKSSLRPEITREAFWYDLTLKGLAPFNSNKTPT